MMRNKSSLRFFIIVVSIVFLTSLYKLPYYISKPGSAEDLNEMVVVEEAFPEEGSFMLTTVRMGRANIYSYAFSLFGKYTKVLPIASVQPEDESDEEYNIRQLHYMSSSKVNAIEAAFNKANIPIQYKHNGVYVLGVNEDMPAHDILKAGDRIFKIDNNRFSSQDEFIDYVASKEVGEEIKIKIERNEEVMSKNVKVEAFPDDPDRKGVGIVLVEDREIITTPKVDFETKSIGGPSAGLMFALEIYNQLMEEDYTKGYKIAGTGTISKDGLIGKIGGVDQKVVAAHKAGAKYFLAPFDEGRDNSDFDIAVETAKKIKTDMEIIGVDTFDEAISFLESLN